MDENHKQIHDYIIDRTETENVEAQKEVINKLVTSNRSKDISDQLNEKILENVKPEYINDVIAFLNGFAQNF
ncbi:hypothetical protein [Mycoplasma sp. P36-A1]|uniref:hypothetical protein n=1 Tax=Mycoplasma sp. P36-A1 TaxID=3252900 RepID=UPI003C2F7191